MSSSTLRTLLLCALSVACSDERAPEYGFEDVDVGQVDPTRAPRAKSNGQFLRTLYADALGRAPESYEFVASVAGEEAFRFPVDEELLLSNALEGLSDVTALRSVLITALLSSEESKLPERADVKDPEAFIADAFRRVLGREPSVYELSAFARAFREDENVQPRVILQALLQSREYQSD